MKRITCEEALGKRLVRFVKLFYNPYVLLLFDDHTYAVIAATEGWDDDAELEIDPSDFNCDDCYGDESRLIEVGLMTKESVDKRVAEQQARDLAQKDAAEVHERLILARLKAKYEGL